MENKQRLINGKAMLQRVDAETADHVMASLDRVAPDVAKLILEFAFNDIYTRPGLLLQQRELVTITSLLTQGDTADQLRVHLNGCLNVGLSRTEIVETCIHCIPYVGFPKVLNALTVVKEVFAKKEDLS
ncbi:carboxymuconolactone decarboxylase family protein [Lactiplantibacillus plantarum]|uniref:carboxymuconolactone decarboxylase family protein n=1 Tax=Lactiplantibacillus plantarum TaxID=1590 RepID=UPI001D0720A9|nr:carboxymuconolactone decarboxylase family protein [Lactiplantibacillus plantarum]MCB7466614.1 carboxymuconolactone decarboxylase family protein [Lactiplantibacillus plantarum]MCB7469054.1 carboxymuconolactone decarboxylase family protein [Lactiplantibacillus plantarum]MCB7472304.1 carboxymuconolactone decarboxylase family protein [Lactiplantibacillus plantarum]MCB7476120.1 carboxymuconolactone decarboxylase family protein [Lactiplantibacillus plantarum]MCB7478160.1 carboxymuconolactone deca